LIGVAADPSDFPNLVIKSTVDPRRRLESEDGTELGFFRRSVTGGNLPSGFAESFPRSVELMACGEHWPLLGKELEKRANTSAWSFIR